MAAAPNDLSLLPSLWRQVWGGNGTPYEMLGQGVIFFFFLNKAVLFPPHIFLDASLRPRFPLKDYSPLIYLHRPPIRVSQPDNDLMLRSQLMMHDEKQLPVTMDTLETYKRGY